MRRPPEPAPIIQLDFTDDELAALVRLLKRTIEGDRYSTVAAALPAQGDPGEARAAKAAGTSPAAQDLCPAARGRPPETAQVTPNKGPPMTLGAAVAARRLVQGLWPPDRVRPGAAGRPLRCRYRVLDWKERLVCSACGSHVRQPDFLLLGSSLTYRSQHSGS